MRTAMAARPGLRIGQRVLASFNGNRAHLGVISGEFRYGAYPVQFQPVSAHFHCHRVSAYGDANGWTDEEYRVEREKSYCIERARTVEDERREKHPGSPFSMYRFDSLRNPTPEFPGIAPA